MRGRGGQARQAGQAAWERAALRDGQKARHAACASARAVQVLVTTALALTRAHGPIRALHIIGEAGHLKPPFLPPPFTPTVTSRKAAQSLRPSPVTCIAESSHARPGPFLLATASTSTLRLVAADFSLFLNTDSNHLTTVFQKKKPIAAVLPRLALTTRIRRTSDPRFPSRFSSHCARSSLDHLHLSNCLLLEPQALRPELGQHVVEAL